MQPSKLGIITAKYRKKNHLTVRDFAGKCGLSKSYISLLENGRAGSEAPPSPTLGAVISIAGAMEMDANELLQRLGLALSPPVNPALKTAKQAELKPFAHIEPTLENLNAAAREGRLLILPFRPPRKRDVVYVPMYAKDGSVVSHEVTSVAGGVYQARSEYSGMIEFNLYDINRTVFVDRKAAYQALNDWKRSHSDNRGLWVGPASSMFTGTDADEE